MATTVVAVVEIGSSAIRLAVAEFARGDVRPLDQAEIPLAVGQDVFVNGTISRDTMHQAILALRGFREVLDGWHVANEQVRVVATSAVREAANRDTFVDQVALRTGFEINVLEGVEAIYLTYLGTARALRKGWPSFSRANSLCVEVGGGSTEVMVLRRGKMVTVHTLSLGTIRLEQQVRQMFGTRAPLPSFIRDNQHAAFEMIAQESGLSRVKRFVAIGSDVRVAAYQVGRKASEHHHVIEADAFRAFVAQMEQMRTERIVRLLELSYPDAEALIPALLIYRGFLDLTQAQEIVVPYVSIRDGILIDMVSSEDQEGRRRMDAHSVAAATALCRRYNADVYHGTYVADLCLRIFDTMQREHRLSAHHRLLLHVAGIVHEIGQYVNQSGHHKHGQYLVEHSEIFGLDHDDRQIVGNVVRYHRKALPSKAHPAYMALNREQRLVVSKLSAILRVADALDRGHARRLDDLKIEKTETELVLHGGVEGDLGIERFSLASKGVLFEQVFALRPVLRS